MQCIQRITELILERLHFGFKKILLSIKQNQRPLFSHNYANTQHCHDVAQM